VCEAAHARRAERLKRRADAILLQQDRDAADAAPSG
jgi:hypothetical protein